MIYKSFKDLKLSALGLGCMRLPTIKEADRAVVDVEKTKEMVAYAMANGINYFDTAWAYHGGQSELVMGEVLKAYPRDSYYLATKFPGYDVSNMANVKEIFEEQLKKCGVDYFDFYLFHNVAEKNINEYLDPKFGIFDYLMEQKRKGRIRHLGFSTHGTLETMKRFLDAYGNDMEFCQIQLNWLDWTYQDAKAKVELITSYGLPVWVMEPVRGGSLVKLDPAHEETLRKLRPEWKNPEWAFRFLQSIPSVTMTLSGMSNMDQLKENIATYRTEYVLKDEERDALLQIAKDMTSKDTLACTACRYCTEHCPQEMDIPEFIKLYNRGVLSGGVIPAAQLAKWEEDKRPSACLGCQACEAVCPQNIKISEMMKDFTARVR